MWFGEVIPDKSAPSGSRPSWLQSSAAPCWKPQIPLRIIRLEPYLTYALLAQVFNRQTWNSVTSDLFLPESRHLPPQLTYVSAVYICVSAWRKRNCGFRINRSSWLLSLSKSHEDLLIRNVYVSTCNIQMSSSYRTQNTFFIAKTNRLMLLAEVTLVILCFVDRAS